MKLWDLMRCDEQFTAWLLPQWAFFLLWPKRQEGSTWRGRGGAKWHHVKITGKHTILSPLNFISIFSHPKANTQEPRHIFIIQADQWSNMIWPLQLELMNQVKNQPGWKKKYIFMCLCVCVSDTSIIKKIIIRVLTPACVLIISTFVVN